MTKALNSEKFNTKRELRLLEKSLDEMFVNSQLNHPNSRSEQCKRQKLAYQKLKKIIKDLRSAVTIQ